MFHLSARVWVSVFDAPKFFPRGQTFGTKSAKKCCHIGTLEAFHLWSLATSVKAQRSTSRSPPITLLDFLHLSIDRPSVKTPLGHCHRAFQGRWGQCLAWWCLGRQTIGIPPMITRSRSPSYFAPRIAFCHKLLELGKCFGFHVL